MVVEDCVSFYVPFGKFWHKFLRILFGLQKAYSADQICICMQTSTCGIVYRAIQLLLHVPDRNLELHLQVHYQCYQLKMRLFDQIVYSRQKLILLVSVLS